MIEKLIGGKEGVEEYETANYSNATNSDAPDDEKFEIKTEGEAEIITISPNMMDEKILPAVMMMLPKVMYVMRKI